jgi:hypothetical protein
MKQAIQILRITLLSAMALTLVHCAKKSSSSTTSAAAASCMSGQLQTAVGCLPQCGTNMVYYNNQCLATTAVTNSNAGISCGTGMLQSQYGCMPQCGVNSVIYNNQCVPANSTGGNIGLCQGSCGAGQTLMPDGHTCLPQFSCGACYGFANGYCYIGAYAHQYYGM